ncbi:MAG: chemotaxis response regulator protein-glutamate methylesterase [Hyphomicrobiales bacterium]
MTGSVANIATAAKASEQTSPIRAMVVDDAIVVRGQIGKWLDEEPDIEVVARHRNGKDAVDDLLASNPDVVILDIEMPVMDGLTALQEMLKLKPGLCVIMASTLTLRNAEVSLKALGMGATDYLPKPEGGRAVSSGVDFRRELISKTRFLGTRAKLRLLRQSHQQSSAATALPAKSGAAKPAVAIARPAAQASQAPKPTAAAFALKPFSMVAPRILVIGSSTGGPQALTTLFEEIGSNIRSVPVVVAQHMPPNFTAILAKNLGRCSGKPAEEASDGKPLLPGHIYVAPGSFHTVLQRNGESTVARLQDTPPINFCKPAVDPMFQSAAEIFGPSVLSLVLTGMGSDGAGGVKTISDKGGSVIAQDEESSVVWGMPKAAAESGCCSAVLPLNKIGPAVSRMLTGGRP